MPDLKAIFGERLKSLSEMLVLGDMADGKSLRELEAMLVRMQSDARRESLEDWSALSGSSAALVRRVASGEEQNPESAIDAISQAVSAMQYACEGGSLKEIPLPSSLTASQEVNGDDGIEASGDEPEDALSPALLMSELPRFLEEFNEHLDTANKLMLDEERDVAGAETLNAIFRCFHTIKGNSSFLGLKSMERLAHKAEFLLDKARSGEVSLSGSAADCVYSAIDAFRRMALALKDVAVSGISGAGFPALPEFPRLEERLALAAKGKSLDAVAATDAKLSETRLSATGSFKRSALVRDIIKVDAERLDRLLEAVGELLVAETMVARSDEFKAIASPAVHESMSRLEKMTREIQSMGMSLRMLPIGGVFQKMARILRDLSRRTGKDVELSVGGEDTELDKSVVDSIGDPLLHLVRNALDHGIEGSPEERVAAGKPAKGRIALKAFHKGGSIHIEVSDDGRGIDKGAVLKKAVERGLVNPGDDISGAEVLQLIFSPGFSTAEKLTEVSGRGVGLDVVRKAIEALRGHVEVRTSPGRGSVFSIRLPLTLAVIDGMTVWAGKALFIIPLLSVCSSTMVARADVTVVQGRVEMINYQGRMAPLFRLAEIFGEDRRSRVEDADSMLVVVVESDGMKAALAIDRIIGQQQIVIKSLGGYLKSLPGIAGGAVMPDGSIGLILDIGGVLRLAGEERVKLKSEDLENV